MHKLLLLLLLPCLIFSFVACGEKEEPARAIPKKAEEPLPPLTQERFDKWVRLTGDVGEFIKRFALKEEMVGEKRDLMLLVHGSSRTQLAYTDIFEKGDMKPREFWNIIDEMEKAGKYLDIKEEERTQNSSIDELVSAGKEEIEILKIKIEKESSEERRLSYEESIKGMDAKIKELEGMKGHLSSEALGVGGDLIDLWNKNKETYKKSLSAMWKVDPESKPEPYRHF